jgi:hypothetical protein
MGLPKMRVIGKDIAKPPSIANVDFGMFSLPKCPLSSKNNRIYKG